MYVYMYLYVKAVVVYLSMGGVKVEALHVCTISHGFSCLVDGCCHNYLNSSLEAVQVCSARR